jgi:hypothetical protein
MAPLCVIPVSDWSFRRPLRDRLRRLAALAASVLLTATVTIAQQPVNADAKTLTDFTERVKKYLELHNKFESTLPKLPADASPAQMDKHQRLFGPLVQKARAGARQGEIFTPDMQAFVRKITRRTFSGPDGKQMIGSIMDENPVGVKITVNGRYPDEVPLSTMPPDLLKELPKLPEEMEFRFVGDRLILLDKHAHLIVDWVDNVLPIKGGEAEEVAR